MQMRIQAKVKNRMANSVAPDEMFHSEPSHLDLQCLRRYLFRSARLKGGQLSDSGERICTSTDHCLED